MSVGVRNIIMFRLRARTKATFAFQCYIHFYGYFLCLEISRPIMTVMITML